MVLAFAYRRLAWHLESHNFGAVQGWEEDSVEDSCIEVPYPGLPVFAGLWGFVASVRAGGVLMVQHALFVAVLPDAWFRKASRSPSNALIQGQYQRRTLGSCFEAVEPELQMIAGAWQPVRQVVVVH